MSSQKQRTNGAAWRGTASAAADHALTDHADQMQLEQFDSRLTRCLTDLGRLDYNLQSAIDGLLTGLDHDPGRTLRGQLAEITEPALRAKMLDMGETLRDARELTRLSMRKPSYLA